MAAQKQEEDEAGKAFDATLSESENDSDDDDAADLGFQKYEKHQTTDASSAISLTADEIAQNRQEFRAMMEV